MGFAESFLLGAGFVLAGVLLFGGVLIARLSSGSKSPATPAGAPAAAVTTSPPPAQAPSSPKLAWVTNRWALAVEVPLIVAFIYFFAKLVKESNLGAEFWFTGILVLILAIAGALGKAGFLGKVALGLVGMMIAGTFIWWFIFREDSRMVGEHVRVKAMTAVLTESKTEQPVAPIGPPAPQKFTAVVDEVTWQTVETPAGKCIWARVADPALATSAKVYLDFELSGANLNFIPLNEWKRLKSLGKAPFDDHIYIRWKAHEGVGMVETAWEFREKGACR